MSEVLLLCEYATLNGGERSMLATFDGVHAAGFSPVVMAPPEGPLAEELAARNIELIPFHCRDVEGSRISQNRLREELAGLLRHRHPSLLHANSLAMGRLSGPVARELQLPSIVHLRDIIKLSAQAVADLNCHRRLLAVSNAVRAFHVAGGLAAEITHVVYNGVDLEKFRPSPPTGYLHRELHLPEDAVLIGSIGQIGLRKGQDLLLQAAAAIARTWLNVHYLIVGERNSSKDESRQFEENLQDISDVQLKGMVHFLGRRDDVDRLLHELTLLVHAARQEPLGRVLLEAAAAGVAIVATNVGGTLEIFPPESGAARLVPAGDAEALAAAMLELLGNPAWQSRLSTAARRRAEERFDIRTAVQELIQHYRVVCS